MPKIQELRSTPKEGKTSSYHTIAIPAQYMRLLGWKKGTELIWLPAKDEKTLLVKEMESAVQTPKDIKEKNSSNPVHALLKQAKEAGIDLSSIQEELLKRKN